MALSRIISRHIVGSGGLISSLMPGVLLVNWLKLKRRIFRAMWFSCFRCCYVYWLVVTLFINQFSARSNAPCKIIVELQNWLPIYNSNLLQTSYDFVTVWFPPVAPRDVKRRRNDHLFGILECFKILLNLMVIEVVWRSWACGWKTTLSTGKYLPRKHVAYVAAYATSLIMGLR